MATDIKQNTPKIGSINTLRFIAAIAVMFYHFAFVFYHSHLKDVNIPLLRNMFQYGYLGVDLFFIISGFVISLSIEGRGPYAFVKSRIGRLYPVFWVSAIITTLFIIFGGHLIDSEMSWYRFLTNMIMVPTLIFDKSKIDFLDGSYWTLAVEMKFYLIILLMLLFKQIKRIETYVIPVSFITMIIALTGIGGISIESDFIWISNFLAGILFYKIYKHGLTNTRIFGLCMTFITSIIYATNRAPYLSEGYKTYFSPSAITLYILSFYIIFLLISLNKIKINNNKYINTLGLLTYPVYLLHQQISKILFHYANIKEIPLYISFISISLFIIIISYIVHKIFEKRGKILLDNILDKITPQALKRL